MVKGEAKNLRLFYYSTMHTVVVSMYVGIASESKYLIFVSFIFVRTHKAITMEIYLLNFIHLFTLSCRYVDVRAYIKA